MDKNYAINLMEIRKEIQMNTDNYDSLDYPQQRREEDLRQEQKEIEIRTKGGDYGLSS